jgi:hypothetical protein
MQKTNEIIFYLKKNLIALLLAILVFSCATPYQNLSFNGGYSDTKLSKNIFSVRFNGNGFTDLNHAIDFALLRSAEIAIENGYNFFSIIDQSNQTTYNIHTTPIYHNNIAINRNNSIAYQSGGQTYLSKKPSTINTIICFEKEPKNNSLIVYEARFIIDSIKNKYQIY